MKESYNHRPLERADAIKLYLWVVVAVVVVEVVVFVPNKRPL